MNYFDENWEYEYKKGKMLNKYPHDRVVSLAFKYLSRQDKNNIKVLDLGCGAGNNTFLFANEGFHVTGIDGSQTSIDFAIKRFEFLGLNATFHNMFFNQIDTLGECYDFVLDRESICTLEWEDVVETYQKVSKVLTKNGVFVSFFYNKNHPDKKFATKTNNNKTFYDLTNGVWGNSQRITLLNESDLNELLSKSNLQLVELSEHSIKPIYPIDVDNQGMSEFIIVAKKLK